MGKLSKNSHFELYLKTKKWLLQNGASFRSKKSIWVILEKRAMAICIRNITICTGWTFAKFTKITDYKIILITPSHLSFFWKLSQGLYLSDILSQFLQPITLSVYIWFDIFVQKSKNIENHTLDYQKRMVGGMSFDKNGIVKNCQLLTNVWHTIFLR